MTTKRIETMEKWLMIKRVIVDKGYTVWQTQYDTDNADGYHVWFIKGDKTLEIVTHNKDIALDLQHDLF